MRRDLALVVAMARGGAIGRDNALPWRLPEDLKHFKALTLGHHIVMGRKTYESIGKPLPGRTTVIVTRDRAYRVDGCLTANSIDAAILACGRDPEIFFVGGADLYAQVLPRAHRLYLTEIQAEFEGDAWFPAFDRGEWRERERDTRVSAEGLGYDFVRYERGVGGA